MKYEHNSIANIMHHYKTQQHPTDMRAELEFIRCHNPKHIVELGTCHAGWPLTINHILQFNEKTLFTLIETFAGNEFTFLKNKTHDVQLEYMNRLISKKSSTLNYNLKFDNEVETIKDEYDVFRYDGYSKYDIFKQFVDKATDNALIIVHDQNFINEFFISLYSIKYMTEHNLYPMFFGHYTGIFCKSKEYKEFIFSKVNFSTMLDERRMRFHSAGWQQSLDNVYNIDLGDGFYTAKYV